LPFLRGNQAADAAIGNDLHLPIGEVHIDQHAAIVFCVPDAVTCKKRACTFASGDPAPYLRCSTWLCAKASANCF
jgi:hypothetical protein